MATASIRKQAIQNLVTQIAAVNGASPYFYDLTGQDQVTSKAFTRDQRARLPFSQTVEVIDGSEEFPEGEISGQAWQAVLEIVIECRVKNRTDAIMREELADLLHDVMLAIGTDVSLNGVVTNLHAVSIEEPVYTEREGTGIIRTQCEYDFTSGTTI